MLGKLLDLLRDKKTEEFSDPENPVFSEALQADDGIDDHGFAVSLRKKRRAAMIKRMLAGEGYGDLARMISIKENP